LIDVPPSAIRDYLDRFKSEQRGYIANLICDGESFINAFDEPKIKVVLDVLSENCQMEFDRLLVLIREGKYEDLEELRRVRQHCIGVNKILEIIVQWKNKLDVFEKHIDKL